MEGLVKRVLEGETPNPAIALQIEAAASQRSICRYMLERVSRANRIKANADDLRYVKSVNCISIYSNHWKAIWINAATTMDCQRFELQAPTTVTPPNTPEGIAIGGTIDEGILTPFDAEIRRRSWWHVCFLDVWSAEECGTSLFTHRPTTPPLVVAHMLLAS